MVPLNTSEDINTTVDVLLICALKDEYYQVLEVTDGLAAPGWTEHTLTNGLIVSDANFATISGVSLSIRATHASHMGREQVQAIASKLIQEQPARCIAMSGICGGRRGKVALGDVIFADRLWSYDAGKITIENEKKQFQGDMLQYRPSPAWVQRMQRVTIPLSDPWLLHRPELPLEYQEDWVLLCILDGEDPRQHQDFSNDCPNWSEVLPRLWSRKWLEKPLELTTAGRKRAAGSRYFCGSFYGHPCPTSGKNYATANAFGGPSRPASLVAYPARGMQHSYRNDSTRFRKACIFTTLCSVKTHALSLLGTTRLLSRSGGDEPIIS